MQIKTTMKFHYIPIRLALIQKQEVILVGKNTENWRPSCTAWTYGNAEASVEKCDPATSSWVSIQRTENMGSNVSTCMFKVTPTTTAIRTIQSTCPTMGKWINSGVGWGVCVSRERKMQIWNSIPTIKS